MARLIVGAAAEGTGRIVGDVSIGLREAGGSARSPATAVSPAEPP